MRNENNREWTKERFMEYFPEEHINHVMQKYSYRQINFITSRLTKDEMRAVRDPEDYLTAAVVSHMPIERWKMYEKRYEITNRFYLNGTFDRHDAH